jgi:phenylacetic acid degradation operon negative regulatory protein
MPSLRDQILISLYEGLVYLLNPYDMSWGNLQYTTNSIYKAVTRLEKDGLLKKRRKENKIYLHLTEKGKNTIRDHRKAGGRSRRTWDEKWRVVIFDVPEKRAEARRYLRSYLKSLGFGKVQRSTWITPYDFGKLIYHFSRKMDLFDCIYQMTVEEFRGLTGVEVAQTFWTIKTINLEYQNLIKIHSELLSRLQKNNDSTDLSESQLGKRFLRSLVWDYQSIAARDPHLPAPLLPSDWAQRNALDFIEQVKNTFKLIDSPGLFIPFTK